MNGSLLMALAANALWISLVAAGAVLVFRAVRYERDVARRPKAHKDNPGGQ